ncbi:hypothetical protein QL285_092522 [Trifolium repens]|nr:hypothetical protein QL285_092522 [Trifolium repens]
MDGFKHCLVFMLSNLLKGKWNSMRGAWLGNSRIYNGSRTAIWPDVDLYFYGRKSYIATYWEHWHLQDYRRGGFLGVTDCGGGIGEAGARPAWARARARPVRTAVAIVEQMRVIRTAVAH